jgi:hypothetical protein
MLESAQIFPAILTLLDLAASVVYLTHGDIRRCVYWAAAAVITVAVTF